MSCIFDKIFSFIFKYLFFYTPIATLMANTSSSSFPLTPSKPQRLVSIQKEQRRKSKASLRNLSKQSKHKIEKVKALHRTPSGREPKQKKILRKEDLQSYDKEDLVDVMSTRNSEERIKTEDELIGDDQSQLSITNSSLAVDLQDIKLDSKPSHSSSIDVNLSQKTEESVKMQANDEVPRLPQFFHSATNSFREIDPPIEKSFSANSGKLRKPMFPSTRKKSAGNKRSRAKLATGNKKNEKTEKSSGQLGTDTMQGKQMFRSF